MFGGGNETSYLVGDKWAFVFISIGIGQHSSAMLATVQPFSFISIAIMGNPYTYPIALTTEEGEGNL